MGIEVFRKHLREKRAIKINSGIDNYNLDNIARICRASQKAKASAVGVACSKEVFSAARKNTKLPVFVSSIHPFELLQAVQWGADAIEIGDFSAMYKQGSKFSMEDVYNIVLETLSLINKYDVFVCVTIPGCIKIEEQIELAKRFEILGIDLIQLEGIKEVTVLDNGENRFVNSLDVATMYTEELYKNSTLPIMTFSPPDVHSAKAIFSAGANAVNVDYNLNNLMPEVEICATIMSIVSSVSYKNSINRELRFARKEMASL